MKRRQFLLTPALGALLPSSLGRWNRVLEGEGGGLPLPEPTDLHQHLHQDFETYWPGVEYFLLGNGEIQAALQYMPDRGGERPMTFLGLTLMDAEHFARKWSTFLFHPEAGFTRSMASLEAKGKRYAATPESMRNVAWAYPGSVPTVRIEWNAGSFAVREELMTPVKGKYLFRRLFLTNTSPASLPAKVFLSLVPSFALFDEIGINQREHSVEARGFSFVRLYALEREVVTSGRYDLTVTTPEVPAGATHEVVFVYDMERSAGRVTRRAFRALLQEASGVWAARHTVETGDPLLDHLFAVSRSSLVGMISKSGKRDSGIWMYNMEWVRDDMMVTLGLLHAGFHEEAKTLLVKALERSVGADGRTIESSRWFGYDLTELDQNGELLYALWAYFCWTGDEALIRKYWKKIALAADFPLQEVFWDQRSGMLHNQREYWERGGSGFGVEDGFELAYQFWVALGLEKAAGIARLIGKRDSARRWSAAAAKITSGMLQDPTFRLIENGALIKRRTRDGRWQRYMIPANRSSMPPGSPLATLEKPEMDPDTSVSLPIAFGMIDPSGPLAKATLESIERLWNQRWSTGGYSRYNTDSEPDPPAPWPFATLFLARAYSEMGDHEKVWRALRWLASVHGGKAGAWFERYGPSITPPAPPVCIVGWTWAEFALLFVRHFAGIRPEIDRLAIQPKPLKGIDRLRSTQKVRGADVELIVLSGTGKKGATVNGKEVRMIEGRIEIPYPKKGTSITVEIAL
jgi:hypothetical protein